MASRQRSKPSEPVSSTDKGEGGQQPTQRDYRGITVKDFVQKVIKEGRGPREKEHAMMLRETPVFYSFIRNADKNVYSNIPLLEGSRIPLESFGAKDDNDYIHASFLRTYVGSYILTQEIMNNTTYDIWRLIWQENSRVIVTLQEGVPNDLSTQWYKKQTGTFGSKMHFNAIKIRTIEIEEHRFSDKQHDVDHPKKKKRKENKKGDKPDYTVYTVRVEYNKVVRKVYIVHFQVWKRDGLPHVELLLDCIEECWRLDDPANDDDDDSSSSKKKKSKKNKKSGKKPKKKDSNGDVADGPMIVQCDSGVKRSGTFVVIDSVCRALRDSGKADVVKATLRARKRRYGVMQQFKHYCFVYDCMMVYAARNNMINKQCQEYKLFSDEIHDLPDDAGRHAPARTEMGNAPKTEAEDEPDD